MNNIEKLVLGVTLQRPLWEILSLSTRSRITTEQLDFVMSAGGRNVIYVLRIITEWKMGWERKDLPVCFIDYTKALTM